MQDLDRLLTPEKRFLDYQDYLIDLIASSYHKSFKDIIATRIKNAFYFFDSTPDVTCQNIKNFNPNMKILVKYHLLNINYTLCKIMAKGIGDLYYYNYLKKFLKINNSFFIKNKDLILNLNFEAFSKESNNFLKDNTTTSDIRNIIRKSREIYLNSCKSINLEPITDENSIEEYLKIKNDIDATNKNTTTSTSIFGKNTVKRLKNKNNSFLIDPDILASDIIYLDDKMAITVLVKTAKNKLQTILAFPLLKQYQSQGLDIALLHELIHISEIKLESMHNPLFSKKEYIPFNEFRTQEKAITLFTKLREDNIHIFDQDDNDDTIYKSYYDEFFYLIEPLLDKYRELIDYCAINNRLSPLYKTLGRDKFDECCNSLSKLFSVSILVDEKLNEMKTYSKRKINK